MKIGLAAYDKGPNNMFGLVAAAARAAGHEAVLAPDNATWGDDLLSELATCQVVGMGFASFESHQEAHLAGLLRGLGVPFVLVQDVAATGGRIANLVAARAPVIAAQADGLVVAMSWEVEPSREKGFREVQCIAPPHWGPSYEALTATGDPHEGLGVRNLPLITVFGTKELELEKRMAELAIAAGCEIWGSGKFAICCHLHPKLLRDASAESASDIPGYSGILRDQVVLGQQSVPLAQALRAATVVLFSGGPMESITGAFARLPLISLDQGSYPGGTIEERNRKQGFQTGRWFVSERSGAVSCSLEQGAITGAIRELLTDESRDWLHAAQQREFPIPESWDTAPRIVQFLCEIA